jgi:hypothetical protein
VILTSNSSEAGWLAYLLQVIASLYAINFWFISLAFRTRLDPGSVSFFKHFLPKTVGGDLKFHLDEAFYVSFTVDIRVFNTLMLSPPSLCFNFIDIYPWPPSFTSDLLHLPFSVWTTRVLMSSLPTFNMTGLLCLYVIRLSNPSLFQLISKVVWTYWFIISPTLSSIHSFPPTL